MVIGIIEDDKLLRKALDTSLKNQGYTTILAASRKEAIKNIDSSVDLLIVDIGLPDGDGINLYQELQKNGKIPAIFLTAKDDEKDMLKAFDTGADDYVVKPFSIKVLLKRIEVVLKRKSNENTFMCGQVILYSDRKQVFVGETEIFLTVKEYQLLEYLIMNQNQVLTKEMLSVMYLEWDIEWEISMVVAISTVLLIGFILGGSTVYLVENHLRAKEMNKIYKLTESLINGNELDGSDIGKETLYSKTTNQLIRLQEMLEGRRKEAEKSQYEIQKLISEIAHQLRTPLSNIKNYTELLQESLNETQEVLNAEYMKDLRTSEEQLCFLVESFIKTARLEQGIIQVHMQKENLVETILNALGQIQKKAEEKEIFFQVELPEKIICEHDKNWMCEAFYNVFDNAVKYSKNNSTINITMKQTEMFYKIQVRDYGIGIRDGEENKIFQRFYRGEQARGQEGCGIGLYLSREIVLLQKGMMKAKQMKPGLLIEVNLPVETVHMQLVRSL